MLKKLFLIVFVLVGALQCQVTTKLGADVLLSDHKQLVAGKKIAVVSNVASLCSDGIHIIDKLLNNGEKVKVIFSPEHGFSTANSAGQKIGNSTYKQTDIPIISLYGELKKPKPEMLQDIDVIVYDLQDVGARFYTYISTMVYAMQAAAEAGKPFVILDRPNPLGGTLVDGPILEQKFSSFVGIVKIPVVYGLTCGELAGMVKGEKLFDGLEKLQLTVVSLVNYSRSTRFEQTGLKWNTPSPNIPDIRTAIIYPGTCMFEATNISEGRGTEAPFLTIGAPSINKEVLMNEISKQKISGLSFRYLEFIPKSIPGKSVRPKRENEVCRGIKITVTDPDKVMPFAAGIKLLYAFKIAGGDSVEFRQKSFERLSGVADVYQMLKAGKQPDEIISVWHEPLKAFKNKSEKYYLYK